MTSCAGYSLPSPPCSCPPPPALLCCGTPVLHQLALLQVVQRRHGGRHGQAVALHCWVQNGGDVEPAVLCRQPHPGDLLAVQLRTCRDTRRRRAFTIGRARAWAGGRPQLAGGQPASRVGRQQLTLQLLGVGRRDQLAQALAQKARPGCPALARLAAEALPPAAEAQLAVLQLGRQASSLPVVLLPVLQEAAKQFAQPALQVS